MPPELEKLLSLATGIPPGLIYLLLGAGAAIENLFPPVPSDTFVLLGGGSLMVYYVPHWGSLGPWVAASALIIGTAFFLAWRWHREAWMKINLFKGRTAPAESSETVRATASIETPEPANA